MIRERYQPLNLFTLVPLTSGFEPELAQLDHLLDDDVLFTAVKTDLARRRPHSTETGRPSTPVEVILRLLIVKHLYGWSYEETERFVSDSLVLRQFTRVYLAPVPDDTTLLRWANLIQPQTLHDLLDRVVHLGCQHKLTRGRKLRVDTTVVATHIHHPTDSSLLADGVRVLSRVVRRAAHLVAEAAEGTRELVRDRTRAAKRLAHAILETTRRLGEEAATRRKRHYRRLLAVARASLGQAERVGKLLADCATPQAERLRAQLEHFTPLVEGVVSQAERRVVHGETVPADAKVLSLFEPETAVIRRGKLDRPTEFGAKLLLDETEGGIVSRYAVLPGNPADAPQLPASLEHHRTQFARAPEVLAGDRGFHSGTNERAAEAAGVKHLALPKPGAKSAQRQAHERQRWFRQAGRFRAGIEGRISVLKRRFRLDRCRYHGRAGMERWVGWGIIAHDLLQISRRTARQAAA
jgi:transposase, IS5 family